MPSLPAFLRLAGALGVPVERFAEGMEDPAGLDAAPTAATRHRDARLPATQEEPKERKTRRPQG